ncbi:MAG: hypothetical protein D6814_11005, partial [Calditrichaeota bacterium]
MDQFERQEIASLEQAAKALELDKVLQWVGQKALSAQARRQVLSLPILSDPEQIRRELEKV